MNQSNERNQPKIQRIDSIFLEVERVSEILLVEIVEVLAEGRNALGPRHYRRLVSVVVLAKVLDPRKQFEINHPLNSTLKHHHPKWCLWKELVLYSL